MVTFLFIIKNIKNLYDILLVVKINIFLITNFENL